MRQLFALLVLMMLGCMAVQASFCEYLVLDNRYNMPDFDMVTPKVDQLQGALFVSNTVKAPIGISGPKAQRVGMEMAFQIAKDNVLDSIRSIKVTGYATLGDLYDTHTLPEEMRKALRDNIFPVATRWDGETHEITLITAISLTGPGTPGEIVARQLIAEQDEMAKAKTPRVFSFKEMTMVKGNVPKQFVDDKYTGIILDTRGMKYVPARLFKLVTVEGAEAWGTAGVVPQLELKIGLADVTNNIKDITIRGRAGARPRLIRPLGTSGALHGDLVISNADAELLKTADIKTALENLNITILID